MRLGNYLNGSRLTSGEERPAAEADRSLALLVCSTGHTAVALGGVVLQVGGWRRPASGDDGRELLKTNRDRRIS